MNITLSANALSVVDSCRKAHNIRTRKAAVEAIILKISEQSPAAEHPLDKKLREARANPSKEKIPARVQRSLATMREERAAGTLQTFSHQEMMQRLAERKHGNSH